jgi:hypothetical protein
MAKSLEAEMAAIEAEERKLADRRKAHRAKLRETAIGTVEKGGLLKLPLDRLERFMEAVKTLGMDEPFRDRCSRHWPHGFAHAASLFLEG